MTSKNKEDGSHLNTELPLKVRLGTEYDLANWGIYANLILTDSKTEYSLAQQATPKTPGYGILDIGGYWQAQQNLRLQVNVHNVLDKKYWTSNDMLWLSSTMQMQYKDHYSQTGRAISANVEFKF